MAGGPVAQCDQGRHTEEKAAWRCRQRLEQHMYEPRDAQDQALGEGMKWTPVRAPRRPRAADSRLSEELASVV